MSEEVVKVYLKLRVLSSTWEPSILLSGLFVYMCFSN